MKSLPPATAEYIRRVGTDKLLARSRHPNSLGRTIFEYHLQNERLIREEEQKQLGLSPLTSELEGYYMLESRGQESIERFLEKLGVVESVKFLADAHAKENAWAGRQKAVSDGPDLPKNQFLFTIWYTPRTKEHKIQFLVHMNLDKFSRAHIEELAESHPDFSGPDIYGTGVEFGFSIDGPCSKKCAQEFLDKAREFTISKLKLQTSDY